MRRILLPLTVLFPSLACLGSPDRGYREIGSGGGNLEVVLTGAVAGTWSVLPMAASELDGNVGLYGPQPPWNATGGRWQLDRTVARQGDSDPWAVDARIDGPGNITWSGGCGVPDPLGDPTVLVFPDGTGASVNVQVPLTNEGLATFDGKATQTPGDQAVLTVKGTWTVEWCRQGSGGAGGPGQIELRWTMDPASLRSWKAPARGAF